MKQFQWNFPLWHHGGAQNASNFVAFGFWIFRMGMLRLGGTFHIGLTTCKALYKNDPLEPSQHCPAQ